MTSGYVEFFDSPGEPRRELLGGKCASLVAMTRAGMPVPPGFAVTTAGYDAFIAHNGIADEIGELLSALDPDDLAAVHRVSARIREAIRSREAPPGLRAEVLAAFAELQSRFTGEVPVAVRSSATAEDLPGASFAGQQDTYLWVVGAAEVLRHIRACWASLYTSRAILYRFRNGIPDAGLSTAVVVQKMVNAVVSGVAITMNPATGDRSKITVEASWGLGELVVSGQVTPDNIVLDKVVMAVVSETIGDKHAELVPDGTVGRLVAREVEAGRRLRRCLTDEQLAQVAAMAKRAERHYGCPQDVEWAFDAELPAGEDLVLLQARPETVHSPAARPATGPALSGGVPVFGRAGGAAPALKSFPKPSELPVPAGALGWEQLYPYNLVFRDFSGGEDERFWFCDSQHWPTVFKPFETVGAEFAMKCLGQYNTRHLLIPRANGIAFKIHLGYLYMSPIPVPEPEVPGRVAEFERRAGHYFANWDSLLENWRAKVRATITEMAALTFAPLPPAVAFEDVAVGRGLDGSEVLLENYDRLLQLCYRAWQYHFEFLNLGYVAYLDFFQFCAQLFPGIPDRAVATMVQGVDLELFRPDDELKRLAVLAVELGLQEAFADTDDVEGTLARVRAAEGGARWLQAYAEAQDPWFNFTVGNGFYGHDKYWLEHQEIPLGFIRDYIRRLDQGRPILRPVDRLVAERDRVVAEYRELVAPEQLADFDAKRMLAAKAYPYVENHNFYIEHWAMGVFWRKIRELGELFAGVGFWAAPEDLLYLTRGEVREALFDLVTGWAVGAEPAGPRYWPAEVERRRGIIDALSGQRPQPALGTPPAEITEPFTMMLWGITTEHVRHWLDEDVADGVVLTGMAASPGVAEGPARVIFDADRLGEVAEGEILVAPVTAPSWGPIFGKIRATVTDIGGMMSHAAIVCREYGLPAVTGTGTGSATIRTGQLIRVDGSTGRVEILGEAGAAEHVPRSPHEHG